MEGTRKWKMANFLTIFLVVAVVVLCAAPCGWAITFDDGQEHDIAYQILGEFLQVDNATVNLLPGAYIQWYVKANDGSTVNIKGGTVGMWIDVALGAEVTVYGTGFNLGEGTHFIDYGTVTGFYENGDPINLTFDCQPDATVTLAAPGGPVGPIEVQIDIKPGSDPNPINPGSNGLIPVAILTTDEFDAAVVDPDTVTLAGREVAVRGKAEKLMARLEDIDEDGDLDLMLQVDTQSDGDVWTSGPVTLTGKTYDGQDIEGTDDVIIVPPE